MSTSSGPIEQTIRRKITESLHPAELQIHNDSKLHAHHAGMRGSSNTIESHFRLDIVSRAFENISKPMRHRLVYKLLAEEMSMADGVHAVQLSTKTPEEAEQQAQQAPQ